MSVGSIEPQFYAALLDGLDLAADDPLRTTQNDRAKWPTMKERFATIFATRTRAEWEARFDPYDACVAPVLTMDEAIENEHMKARGTYTSAFGFTQPAPAPRFSTTSAGITSPPAFPGEQSRASLVAWGLEPDSVDRLIADGAIVQAQVVG